MKIVYVHHGHRLKGNPSTQQDDLTEIGYKDCNLTAELFNVSKIKENFKAIITSPFFRCKKTAEIINKHLNLPIFEDERLNEFRSFENETWLDALNRVIECINDIINKYDNNDAIICVTSGLNVGAFICKFFGIQPSNNTPFVGVPSCSPLVFEIDK